MKDLTEEFWRIQFPKDCFLYHPLAKFHGKNNVLAPRLPPSACASGVPLYTPSRLAWLVVVWDLDGLCAVVVEARKVNVLASRCRGFMGAGSLELTCMVQW